MSMILFAKSVEELPGAIAEANELIQYKRLYRGAAGVDEILGIAIRDNLYRGVPTWKTFDFECGTGSLAESEQTKEESGADAVAMRSAFASRNAWALCAFDGPGLRGAPDSGTRRNRIAALLQAACRDSDWVFLQVYSGENDVNTLPELDVYGPVQRQGASWLRYTPERGILFDKMSFALSSNRIPA